MLGALPRQVDFIGRLEFWQLHGRHLTRLCFHCSAEETVRNTCALSQREQAKCGRAGLLHPVLSRVQGWRPSEPAVGSCCRVGSRSTFQGGYPWHLSWQHPSKRNEDCEQASPTGGTQSFPKREHTCAQTDARTHRTQPLLGSSMQSAHAYAKSKWSITNQKTSSERERKEH